MGVGEFLREFRRDFRYRKLKPTERKWWKRRKI
jgi:hypothetical protein